MEGWAVRDDLGRHAGGDEEDAARSREGLPRVGEEVRGLAGLLEGWLGGYSEWVERREAERAGEEPAAQTELATRSLNPETGSIARGHRKRLF